MYRVILVEDEATVREGMVQKIDWQAHGFQLVGACENGKQALALLEQQPVEVVITDINMPVMDGLSLSKQIHQRWPDTRIVILTGFDDFSYAQSAIRYRVSEYILKPITAKQLRDLLDKLRQELDARLPKAELEKAKAALREDFLRRLLAEEIPADEMERKIRELPLHLALGQSCAALLNTEADPQQALQTLKEIAADWGEVCWDSADRLALLSGGEQPEQNIQTMLQRAAGCLGPVTAVIGPSVGRPGELFHSVAQARAGWEHLYRCAPGGVYTTEQLLASLPVKPDTGEIRRRLLKEIKMLNREQSLDILAEFFGALRDSGLRREAVLVLLRKLTMQLMEWGEQHPALPQDILEQLERQPNLDAAHTCLQAYVQAMLEAGEQQGDSAARQGVRAVEYIKEQYHNPSLSLQHMTVYLSVSTSYFSTMFKNHTGVTFVEFLTRLRMNKARELLATTDKKNYEVAAAVGYDDPGYFRSIFKKTTGKSPSEYRKQMRK